MAIFTVGHSTRSIEEFLNLLKRYQIDLLIDVRTVPKSRHVPHFNSEPLKRALEKEGIGYQHQKGLGGLRKPAKDSINLGWRNASFRGFADYMETDDFRTALEALVKLAAENKVAIMCAEAVPWRCHRSLIADALVVRNIEVSHLLSDTRSQPHALTLFAVADGSRITYPAKEPALFGPATIKKGTAT